MKEHTFTCEIGEGLEVDVFFEHTPEVYPVYYPNDKADPGSPAESEITRIEINGIDIQDCLNIETMNQIESKMNDYINSDTFGAW